MNDEKSQSQTPITYPGGETREKLDRQAALVDNSGYVLERVIHEASAGNMQVTYSLRDPAGIIIGWRQHTMLEGTPGWVKFWGTTSASNLDTTWADAHLVAAQDAGIIDPDASR